MKKLFLVVLVLTFCVPVSAELVVYKISCRETLFDRTEDCPEKMSLRETMWLILDVNPAGVKLLECGDSIFLGDHPAVPEVGMFKTWKLGRQNFWDYHVLCDDPLLFVLDGYTFVRLPICGASCLMKGRTRGGIVPRSLNGHLISFGDTAYGKAACSARLNRRMMRALRKKDITTVIEALEYLISIQPDDAIQGDASDPLWLP